MNKLAWSGIAFAIVGVAAAGVGGTACTVTSGTGDDGGITYLDSGTQDTSTSDSGGEDTGTTGDSGGQQDAGADSAVACVTDAGTACDMCLGQSCCAQEVACQSEPLDDAGMTDCEEIASCFNDCVSPPADSGVDAGTPQDCMTACSAGHTQQGQSDFSAVVTCAASSCATQCQ